MLGCTPLFAMEVSIPRSEFWSFGPALLYLHDLNFSQVSIPRSEFWSFGRQPGPGPHDGPTRFQFLGRNSGRSDVGERVAFQTPISGFNSSVGILVVRTFTWIRCLILAALRFQFLGRNSGRSDEPVFKPRYRGNTSFNSSVGILVVRTPQYQTRQALASLVSIPRSEFWSFGHHDHAPKNSVCNVSIPRSEFWSFGQWNKRRLHIAKRGFNSSVGILVVRTAAAFPLVADPRRVSIPRSEFWSFGRV